MSKLFNRISLFLDDLFDSIKGWIIIGVVIFIISGGSCISCLSCGGGNSGCAECESICNDCGSCITCGCDCSGGSGSSYKPTEYVYVEFHYYDADTGANVKNETRSLDKSVAKKVKNISSYISIDTEFYEITTPFYREYDGGELSKKYADKNGKITSDTKFSKITDLYVKIREKHLGEARTIMFRYTVDGRVMETGDWAYYPLPDPMTAIVGQQLYGFPSTSEMYAIDGHKFVGFINVDGVKITVTSSSIFHLYTFGTTEEIIYVDVAYSTEECVITIVNGNTTSTVNKPSGTTFESALSGKTPTSSTGGRFKGWTLNSVTKELIDMSSKITTDVKVYPVFEEPVTITLKNYYGPSSEDVTLDEVTNKDYFQNDLLDLSKIKGDPQGPFTFKYWCKESELLNQVPNNLTLSEKSYTFYAKWDTQYTYKIYYFMTETANPFDADFQDSYQYDMTTAKTLKTAEDISTHIPDGKKFAGWQIDTDKDGVGDGEMIYVIEPGEYGDLYLRPVFTNDKINITLVSSISGNKVVYVTAGSTLGSAIVGHEFPTVAGKGKFKSWSLTEDGNTPIDETKKLLQDTTIYATYYLAVTLTLQYYDGPNSLTAEKITDYYVGDSVNVNNLYGDPQGPYRFLYYTTDKAGYNQVSSSVTLTDTAYTFYAKWEHNSSFYIYYFIEGSANVEDADIIDHYEYSATTAHQLMLQSQVESLLPFGYQLVGWKEDTDRDGEGDGSNITEIKAGSYGDKRMIAVLSAKNFDVLFHPAENGTISNTNGLITYGTKVQVTKPTAKSGWDFIGYYTTTGIKVTDENAMMIVDFTKANLTTAFDSTPVIFVAHYETHKYTLKFYNESASQVLFTLKVTMNTAAKDADGYADIVPETKTGYDFVEWVTTTGSTVFDPTASVTADRSYKAKYQVKTLQITLDANGGTINGLTTDVVNIDYGQKLNLGVPTQADKLFLGWEDSSGTLVTGINGQMTNAYDLETNTTYTARWI